MERQEQVKERYRVPGIDLARGLSIIFMILSHTQLYFRRALYIDHSSGAYATFFDRLSDSFLASDMSAPVFMFVMGMCMVYSRRSSAGDCVARGVRLLLQALLVSVVIMSGTIACCRWFVLMPAEIPNDTWLRDFPLHGDILNFAGLAFLVFALMKLLRFGPRAMLLLSGTFYAAYFVLLATCGTESLPWPVMAVAGWVCGTDAWSCFPLFAWLIYPVAGYVLADALRKSDDPERLLRCAGLVGLAVFAVAFAFSWPYDFVGFPLVNWYGGMEQAFYHQHPVILLRCLGFSLFELWACELLARRIPEKVMSHFRRWSVNVNAMYILSWTIIFLVSEFLMRERSDLSLAGWLTGAVLVFVATDLGITFLKRTYGRIDIAQ